MSNVAPAILIATIVASAQAGPTARPPTDEQKRAADAWVRDAYAWADQLTKLGEGLGEMLADVLDGKQRSDALAKRLKQNTALMDEKAGAFKARPAPAFAEMTAFKRAFLDYLAWEKELIVGWIGGAVRIADDKKLTAAQKKQAVSDSLHANEKDEDARKEQIQTAMKAVYAALNRK